MAHLTTLGPVHVDAVRVGVVPRRDRTLAEVRPMARRRSLYLVLPRTVEHPRTIRTLKIQRRGTLADYQRTGPAELIGPADRSHPVSGNTTATQQHQQHDEAHRDH